GGWPAAPLASIDRTEFARFVGPFVPDAHPLLLQPGDVGLAAQEPEQFDDDRPQVQLLGGVEGEALLEVETHLVAEHAARSDAGAVLLLDPFVENQLEKIEIELHRTRLC